MPLPPMLLHARAVRRHTQPQAAAAVGVSVRTWSRWETGATAPGVPHLAAIAAYLGCELQALVGRH